MMNTKIMPLLWVLSIVCVALSCEHENHAAADPHGIPYRTLSNEGDLDDLLDEVTKSYNRAGRPTSATENIGGNRVQLLDTAEATYEAWSRLLDSAENHIHISMYFFENDVDFAGGSAVACASSNGPAPAVLEKSEIACKIWQAARRGVHVRLITDSVGNSTVKSNDIVTALAGTPGIDVINFNPLLAYAGKRNKLWEAEFEIWIWQQSRIHEKLIVADGQTAIVGGRNIGINYIKPKPANPPEGWGERVYGNSEDYKYRDTDILIEGPAVASVQKLFFRNWLEFSQWEEFLTISTSWFRPRKCLQVSFYRIPYYCRMQDTFLGDVKSVDVLLGNRDFFPFLSDRGDVDIRVVYSSPRKVGEIPQNPFFEEESGWNIGKLFAPKPSPAVDPHRGVSMGERVYLALIESATSSIEITNPFFVLTSRLEDALVNAARRGVKITLLTNSLYSNDPPLVWWCSLDYFREALDAGIKIYEWQSRYGMLHSKTAVFDDKIAIVGSFNLDRQSTDANSELLTILRGQDIIDQLQTSWENDLLGGNVEPMTAESLDETENGQDRSFLDSIQNSSCTFLKSVI